MARLNHIKNFFFGLLLLATTFGYGQLPGYSFNKVIVIQSSQVIGTGSHIDFPVLISEVDPDLATVANGGGVQNNNGYDIRFTASDGTTLLDHQIEFYNPLTGRYVAWVRIPSLSTSANTTIKIHYGSPLGVTNPSLESTWDGNFEAVYHFTNDLIDKTINTNNLVNSGATPNPTGIAARSINFTPGDYLEAPADPSHQISSDITISTWVDLNSTLAGNYQNCLVSCSGATAVAADNTLYTFNVEDDGRLRIVWEYAPGLTEDILSINPISFSAGYTMLSVTRNTTTNEVRFFQDGVPLDASAIAYTNDPTGGTAATLRLGVNQKNPTYELDSEQDETRISNSVRSTAWQRTEFNTANSPSTFYTIGPEVIACDASFSYGSPDYCVTIDPNPLPVVTGDGSGFFTGSPAGITVNGSTGLIDLAISSAGSFAVTYTAPNLCQTTFNVQLNGADDPSFTYTATNFCQGDTDPLGTVTGTTGGLFSVSGGLVLLDANSGEIDLSTSTPGGPYTITYTSPGPECPLTSDHTVNIFAEDNPAFTYTQTTYCQGDTDPSAAITGTSGGTFSAPAQISFLDINTGLIDLSASTAGGPYTITYTTPGPNCPNSTTFDITINPEDIPTIAYSASNYCISSANQLPVTITTPGGAFSEITGNLDVDGSSGLVDFSTSTAGSYYIAYSTTGICPNTDSVQFILENNQDPSFNYLSPLCINGTNPVPASITSPGGTFSESGPNLNFVNATTGEIDLTTTLVGIYTIDYVTPGICANTTSQSIEILQAINPIFSIPDTICLPSGAIDLSGTTSIQAWETSNFYSYPNGGVSLSGSFNELFDPSTTTPGFYSVTHEVDNGGCVDSSTLTIAILPEYISNYFNPDTLCAGYSTYNLNDLFISGSTSSNGVWSGASITNDSIWNIGTDLGDYNLSYIVGFGQCADTTTQTIHVLADLDSSWTVPANFCTANAAVDLDTYVTGTPNGIWSGTGVTGTNFDPALAGVGTHSVSYLVGSPACAENLSQDITVVAIPTAEAGPDSMSCGLDYDMLGVDVGLPSYWISSSAVTYDLDSSSNIANVQVNSYGSHLFYWHVGTGVCFSEDSVRITFFEQPIADAGPDITLNFRFTTSLEAVNPTMGQGIWSTDDGTSIDDVYSNVSVVSELNEGPNVFTWTVSNGSCTTSVDEMTVTVNSIYIPEGLTPNNDNKNDVFIIDGIEELPNKVVIMNRWGQTVYEQENYQNDWGGTNASGELLNPDTYFYIIEVDGTFTYKGFIVLKR